MTGKFIVLEGVEGSGKSTQARRFGAWLTTAGIPHILTREPGGTSTGEQIRRILLDNDEVTARAELLLILAARATLVEQVIEPALAAGLVVLSDRFELSSFAYQAFGRALPLEEVRALNAFATGGRHPDLTVVLDVDPAQGAARRLAAGASPDRIERAGTAFHAAVARAYRLLGDGDTDAIVVPGAGPADEVFNLLTHVLHERFPETFPPDAGLA